jgi:multidrug efflux pump subunit AcrB
MFNRNAARYESAVGGVLHRSLRWMMIYVVLLGGMVWLFLHLPTSFLPMEDRGMFTTSVQLPSGATQQQTLKVVRKWSSTSSPKRKITLCRSSPPSAPARAETGRTSPACLSA